MKRFSIVARLGPDDNTKINFVQGDSDVFNIDFIDGKKRLGFGIGKALERLASLGLRTSERAIDLVMVAALVNAGDTRIPRDINAQDGWTREIDLYIPVSVPMIWDDSAKNIEAMLRFLTGDRWRVFFRNRTDRTKTLAVQPERPVIDRFTEVSLLSGGLDSLIGAIDHLTAGKKPLFIGHYWDGHTSKVQKDILDALKKGFSSCEIEHLRVRLGFNKSHLNAGKTENTQRGRSFLFYALATLAASGFERDTTINIPENGLIALNVPLDPLRFGALSTRTAHPHFIASMQQLIDRVGLQVRFTNPYRHITKGEMVSGCADITFLRKIVGKSMSCSSPTKVRYKRLSPQHCGHCIPCLIRRAALVSGLGLQDPTLYAIKDLRAQTLATDSAEGEHVRAFQLIIKRVKENLDITKILIHKPGPLIDNPAEIPDYADMFRRGVLEVAVLLEGVRVEPSG